MNILKTTKSRFLIFKNLIREFRQKPINTPIEVIVDESLINQLTKNLVQLNSDLKTLKSAVPLLQDRLNGWARLYKQTTDFESHISIDYRDSDYKLVLKFVEAYCEKVKEINEQI